MLRSTENAMSREQFTKLREARRLIDDEFRTPFSLESDAVISDLYDFALRSERNELFDLFVDLQDISGAPVEKPLNKEQFIVLREARGLIEEEFGELLPLRSEDVADKLYDYALRSGEEVLFDLTVYLGSRPELPSMEIEVTPSVGMRFLELRSAGRRVKDEFGEVVALGAESAVADLAEYAQRSDDPALDRGIDFLKRWTPTMQPGSAILFKELSAAEFESLRLAKAAIVEEFADELSLHAASSLDDLYRFALESEETELFELFSQLCVTQWTENGASRPARNWLTNEQYMLLREARAAIRSEFEESIAMQSGTIQDELYQFALKAAEEQLFDVCREFHELRGDDGLTHALPSKEEFRMLRRARALIDDEFGEALQLQSDVLQSDLYKFAVRSESDELFDLHTELMNLESRATPESVTGMLLAKDEFVALRGARTLVREEFAEELELDASGVLDEVYGYALRSKGEQLFDLHAELNAQAGHEAREDDVAEQPANEPEPEPEPELGSDAAVAPETGGLKKLFSVFGNKSEVVTSRERVAARAEQTPTDDGPAAELEGVEDVPTGAASTVDEPVADQEVEELAEQELEEEVTSEALVEQEPLDIDRVQEPVDAPDDESSDVEVDEEVLEAESEADEHYASDEDETDATSGSKESVGFGDRLVRAMERKPGSGEPNPPANRGKKSAKKPRKNKEQNVRDPIRVGGRAEALASATWYVSSLDGRLGIRLLDDMSVCLDGEMFVDVAGAELDVPSIELDDGQPLLVVREADVQVNGESVEGTRALESGDVIDTGGSTVRIDYQETDAVQAGGAD